MTAFFKSKWTLGIIAVIVLGGAYWHFAHRGGASYQFVAVTQGPSIQTGAVTGETTPIKTVALGFQNAGTIGSVLSPRDRADTRTATATT